MFLINNIVTDIIDNSINKNYIELSEDVFEAILSLKNFNYKYIYDKSMTIEDKNYYRESIDKLYYYYLDAIEKKDKKILFIRYFLIIRMCLI